jgi:hypothetical protein
MLGLLASEDILRLFGRVGYERRGEGELGSSLRLAVRRRRRTANEVRDNRRCCAGTIWEQSHLVEQEQDPRPQRSIHMCASCIDTGRLGFTNFDDVRHYNNRKTHYTCLKYSLIQRANVIN